MEAGGEAARRMETTRDFGNSVRSDPRWDLAFLGVLGYVVVEYTRLPAMFPVLIPLELGKVVTVTGLVGLLLSPPRGARRNTIVRRIDLAVIIFLLGGLVSTFAARYEGLAWDGLYGAVLYGLIYLLIGRVVSSSWRLRIFMFVLLLLNFKLAQFSIRYYRHNLLVTGNEMAAVKEGGIGGSVGFFANSADLGVAMCVAWPLATSLLFAQQKKLARWALFVASLTFLVAIFLCGSRGAVVGAAVVVLAALGRHPKKLATGLMACAFLVAIMYILPGASKRRFDSAWTDWHQDQTASNRVYLWKAGLMMISDYPLLGVGIQNFALVRKNFYPVPGAGFEATVAHSIYIQVLSEMGVAGTIPFLLLVMFLFRLNARTRKHLLALDPGRHRGWEYCLAQGLDLALVGYLASGAFVSILFYPHLWVLLGLSVGLNTACSRIQAGKEALEPQGKRMELVSAA